MMPHITASDGQLIQTPAHLLRLLTRWSYWNIWINKQHLLPYFLQNPRKNIERIIEIIVDVCPKKYLDEYNKQTDTDILTQAIMLKNENIIRTLLDADIKIRTYSDFVSGQSALVLAYTYNKPNLVFLILAKLHQQKQHPYVCIQNLRRLDYNDMNIDELYENSKSRIFINVLNKVFYEPLRFDDDLITKLYPNYIKNYKETITLETEVVINSTFRLLFRQESLSKNRVSPWKMRFVHFDPANKYKMETKEVDQSTEINWQIPDENELAKKVNNSCSIVYGPVVREMDILSAVMSTTVYRNIHV